MKLSLFNRGKDADTIRRLVERFLDGDTTPAQERMIYDYFSAHTSLPDDLEQYREMFGWYASLAPAASRFSWPRFAGVAAAIAVLVAVGVTVALNVGRHDNRLYASYKGSYIIRDGQRIDDISAIYANLSMAEQLADSLIDLADRQAMSIERSTDEIYISQVLAGVSDPELANQIKKEILE